VIDRELERLLTPHRIGPELLVSTTVPSPAPPSDAAAALESMREIASRLLLVSLREQEARERADEANRA
jgi:hypothetical protein